MTKPQVLWLGKCVALLEHFLSWVKLAKPRFIDLHRFAHLNVGGLQALGSLFVLQAEHGPQPGRPLSFNRRHFTGESVLAGEVGVIHARIRAGSAFPGHG